MAWALGRGGDDRDDMADIRADDENAILQLFLTYGRDELPRLALGGVASILARFLELVPALILGVAIDSLFTGERSFRVLGIPPAWIPDSVAGQFWFAVGLIAGSYLLGAGLNWVNNWAWNHFSQHVQHRVRVDTYDAVQELELEFFDDKQTGQIMSILNNDVNRLENFLTRNLNTAIRITVFIGGTGIVMLLLNWQLALVPVVVIPVLAGLSYWFVRVVGPKYQRVRSSVGQLNSRLENNVGGIQVVKAYNTEKFESERVEEASEEYLDANWDAITTRIKYFPSMRAITAIAYVGVFILGGWWIIFGPPPFFSEPLSAGVLVTFLMYTRRFVFPMAQFGRIINTYERAQAACQRIIGLQRLPDTVPEKEDAVELEDVDGDVEYEGVTFHYQGEDEPVIDSVSFDVDAGEMVGVVGPTGAGKTTLIKLLVRFYDVDGSFAPVSQSESRGDSDDVDGGAIRIDGLDVRDVTLDSLRGSVGYVSQEPYLFYGTVRENIAYGLGDADDEAVIEAARMAGAHEFITELDDGYGTMVGERGVKLSGGQRQRVAIARAILRDPDILILDEATSHVDNETEVLIQDSLEDLVADRTTFAIAHRLSTIRDADTILVMDEGELVERGTHEELLEHDGLYANLWSVQVGEVDQLPEEFVEQAAERRARMGRSDD